MRLTIEESYAKIKAAGTTQQQAEFILAYLGSIENIEAMSHDRLLKELLRIPLIGHKTANKVVIHFKS